MVCLCSTSNQHVGVNLKAHAIIMMDAFCYCTPSELLSVCARRQKLLIDGIKPSWSLVFIECYQVCLGVLSQRRAIGFPMLLSLGMWIVTGWIPTETGCVSPTRDTVQSEWGRCRNHSLCWSQEVALTSGFRGWLGGGTAWIFLLRLLLKKDFMVAEKSFKDKIWRVWLKMTHWSITQAIQPRWKETEHSEKKANVALTFTCRHKHDMNHRVALRLLDEQMPDPKFYVSSCKHQSEVVTLRDVCSAWWMIFLTSSSHDKRK